MSRIKEYYHDEIEKGMRTDNRLVILIYSPVHGRAEIVLDYVTKWYKIAEQVKDKYIIKVCLSVDRIEDFDKLFLSPAFILRHEPYLSLATKKNQAIQRILERECGHFDYLMEMDSTGMFSTGLLDAYEDQLKSLDPFFGTNRILFHESKTDRVLDYTILNGGVWVSGRFIRADILKRTVKALGYLWKPDLNNGLGVNQENNIHDVTGGRVKIIHTKQPYLYDLKTGSDVTPFETLAKHPGEATEITDKKEKHYLLSEFNL